MINKNVTIKVTLPENTTIQSICPHRSLQAFNTKWTSRFEADEPRWVIPSYSGHKQMTLNTITRFWLRMGAQLNLPNDQLYRAHSGRNSFVNRSISLGVPDRLIAIAANWRSTDMVSIYHQGMNRSPISPAVRLASMTEAERDILIRSSLAGQADVPSTSGSNESQFHF